MFDIVHRPILDVAKAEEMYSERDRVPVRYVCTSAPNMHAAYAADIFYRETRHPEFGNRYFGLYHDFRPGSTDHVAVMLMICNADLIESLDFEMVEVDDKLHYSQHRHDYHCIGDVCIDGGRSYLKLGGNLNREVKKLHIKDGQFIECE